MKWLAAFLFLSGSALPSFADSQCYTSMEDPSWTLTEATFAEGAGFLWKQGDKVTELTVGAIGTGIMARMAVDKENKVHAYLYVRDVLVFDMTPYEPGCKE